MLQIGELLNLQEQMFLLILVGWVLKKKGILTETAKNILTDLLIYFILPCNIVNSFRVDFSFDIIKKFIMILTVSVLVQLFAYMIGNKIYNGQKESVKKVMQYMTLVSNAGFLGFPVAKGVFGADGLMYASVFIIPNRIMMWTAGISCFTGESDKKNTIKKLMIHPCIVAVYIGVFLMISQINLPAALDKTLKGASDCTTTISMVVIGVILAEIDLLKILNKETLYSSVIRLGVMPLIALIISRALGLDAILAGVAILLTAMPAGSSTAMLAAKYDGDYIFAAKCVVFTTILSLLTIPLWCQLI